MSKRTTSLRTVSFAIVINRNPGTAFAASSIAGIHCCKYGSVDFDPIHTSAGEFVSRCSFTK